MTTTRRKLRALNPEYKRWYTKGWRYSVSGSSQGLERGDAINAPSAWYDGYADAATGREKWHLALCAGCVHPVAGPHGTAAA